jgi:hypothetical protein
MLPVTSLIEELRLSCTEAPFFLDQLWATPDLPQTGALPRRAANPKVLNMAEDPAPLYCTTCAKELVAIREREMTVIFAMADVNFVIDCVLSSMSL